MSWFTRIIRAFRSESLDRELEEEFRFHREHRTAEFLRRGMTPKDAEREAARRFGNDLVLRERSRDARLYPRLESIWRDVRFAARMLCKNSVVTAAAVLSLALGIGACTAAFSLIDALILRALPVRDAARLFYLHYPSNRPNEMLDDYFSYPEFERLRDASKAQFELFTIGGARLRDAQLDESTLQVRAQFVSGNSFDALGIRPAAGRLISAEDDRAPGQSPVAVIAYDLWTRLGQDPGIIGRQLKFADMQLRIVGVAEAGFTGTEPGLKVEVWVPNMMIDRSAFTSDGWAWFRILGRLPSGISLGQARIVLHNAFNVYHRERAPSGTFQEIPLSVESAATGASGMRRYLERPLWIVAIMAGLILLIAGSNVANLLMARAAARRSEMALRVSIGAGRGRLVQQVLAESGLLVGASCIVGVAMAYATGPAIVARLLPAGEPAYLDLGLNWKLFGFISFIGASATILFGLVPALRSTAVSPNDVLKNDGGRHPTVGNLLHPLMVAQVAFSFAVLFIGGLFLLSFHNLTSIDTGFLKTGVAIFELDNLGGQAPAQQILDQIRQIPSVRGAGYSSWALLDGNRWTSDISVRGRPDGAVHLLSVSSGFFDTIGVRLLGGRDFAPPDLDPAAAVAIVNERLARDFFPGENPLGKRFNRKGKTLEIIGLVSDAKYLDLRTPPPPTAYFPLHVQEGATLQVHTAGEPAALISLLRAQIQQAVPRAHITRAILQSTLIDNLILRERLLALLAGFFAISAMLLAAIGIYGVLSYSVARRTKEIGIRVALGAKQVQVVWLVVSEIALVLTLGVAAGLAGGFGLDRYVRSLLFEVKPGNATTVVLPLLCLILGSSFAALAPALRAVRLNPVVALRQQ